MPLSLGQLGGGWTQVGVNDVPNAQECKYFAAGYTAAAGGGMAFARVNIFAPGTATRARVYVYGGVTGALIGSPLIAMSAEIDITAAGVRSAAIAGNIIAGRKYALVYQRNGAGATQETGNSGASGTVNNLILATRFPYGNPPATLPNRNVANSGHEFMVWVDGAYGLLCGAGSFGYQGQGAALSARQPQNYVMVCLPGYFNYDVAQSHSDLVLDCGTGHFAYAGQASGGGKTNSGGGPGSGQGDIIDQWQAQDPAVGRRP